MIDFSFVGYGILRLRLESGLHIGGDDEEYSLARNGEDQFILPATTIAGNLRHYFELREDANSDICRMFGSQNNGSRICFYDAVCEDSLLEKRTRARIDHALGTAVPEGLFTEYNLARGAKAEIHFQIFAREDPTEKTERFLEACVSGIDGGDITFGAGSAHGEGRFSVKDARYRILDLHKEEELEAYLKGIEFCFSDCADAPVKWNAVDIEKPDRMESGFDVLELTADIPDGVIIKGGVPRKVRDDKNIESEVDDINVDYKIAGDKSDAPVHYFIPATSIKGVIRSYCERVWHYYRHKEPGGKIDWEDFNAIMGSSDANGNAKNKGHVKVWDAELEEPYTSIHSRIRIDRWLGAVMNGAKMNELVVCTKDKPVKIRVAIDNELDERRHKIAKALVFLALRDMGCGLLTLGSSASIGFGRLQGRSLKIDGQEYAYYMDEKQSPHRGQMLIDYGNKADDIRRLLSSLKGDVQP